MCLFVTNKMQHQVHFLVWLALWSPHGSLKWVRYTNIQINFHAYQQLDTLQQGTFLTKPNKNYCIRTVPHFSFLLTFTCPYQALFGNKFCVPVENVNNGIISTRSQESNAIWPMSFFLVAPLPPGGDIFDPPVSSE